MEISARVFENRKTRQFPSVRTLIKAVTGASAVSAEDWLSLKGCSAAGDSRHYSLHPQFVI
jgi:hypothetical protein